MKKILFFAIISLSFSASAATISWDGGGGNNKWETAANWSTNTLPGAGDSVIISKAFVEIETTQNIRSLRLEPDAQTQLTITKYGTLSIAGGSGTGLLMIGNSKVSVSGILNISNCIDGLVANQGVIELLGALSRLNVSNVSLKGMITGGNVQNGGKITINTTGNYGWENSGVISNNHEIYIVGSGSTGLHSGGIGSSVTNAISGWLKVENANFLGINSFAYFNNQGYLEINNTASTGLYVVNNAAGFFNSGDMYVYFAGIDGINVASTGSQFTNLNSGFIYISYSGLNAISTSKSFKNQGSIEIHYCGRSLKNGSNSDSFENYGSIIMRDSGEIQNTNNSIFRNKPSGILDYIGTSNMLVSSKLINEGHIKLKGGGIINRDNSDSLINKGVIEINKPLNGIFNSILAGTNSIFLNDLGGQIILDSCTTYGIFNLELFINKGEIEITNSVYSFINGKLLENFGKITIINNSGNSAFTNYHAESKTNNKISGQIFIENSNDIALSTRKHLFNYGQISILNSLQIGLEASSNVDTLYNNGTISIKNSGLYGLKNSFLSPIGKIINDTNGIITVDSTGDTGFLIEENFWNKGHINIKKSIINGLHIINNTLKFKNDGEINISDIDLYALKNTSTNTSSIFENGNNGLINIDSSVFGIYNEKRLLNKGQINIKNCSNYALENRSISDSLFNNGIIQIDSSMLGLHNSSNALMKTGPVGFLLIQNADSIGLYNRGVFDSEACAHIKLVNSRMKTEAPGYYGTVLNGLFFYQNPKNDFINAPVDVQGLTVDVFWNLTKNPNFNSKTTVFSPLGSVSNGMKEAMISKVNASPTYSISSTWWIDKNKVNSGGLYDDVNKWFIPNVAGAGSDSLYFEITHNTIGCKTLVALPASNSMTCENNISTSSYSGMSSNNWISTSNWPIFQQLPNACTKVLIQGNKTAIIPSGFKIRTHSLQIDNGAILDLGIGNVFESDPKK